MEQERTAEKGHLIRREDGAEITVHYAADQPSLQDKMTEIMALYQTSSAKS